jgi:predicted pyridoxine 5'-phosphate oxidase superfamily flavin-nucleotide-binding protein
MLDRAPGRAGPAPTCLPDDTQRRPIVTHRFADIVFTPKVQALQEKHGSRTQYARMQAHADGEPQLGPREAQFLAEADSFYLASVGETGWPYVQHRGGPRGFVATLSPTQLAFADFRGNRQYVSAGNVAHDDRVALIVMDYPNRQRLKLLGHLRFADEAEAPPETVAAVALPDYQARVERIAIVDVVAFDWNCPQHITQRFTLEQVEAASRPLHERIATLETKLRALEAA